MKVEIPADAAETPGEDGMSETEAAAGPDQWHIYSFEGERYGPVTKAELEEWVRENRLTADCQVLQEGWPDWKWARDVFPSLRSSAELSFHNPNPAARRDAAAAAAGPPPGTLPGGALPPGAPHPGSESPTYYMPHRGGVILTLGVLGIVLCQILSVPAWLMGQNDLREIRAGRMDPTGQDMTMAGMVLGIIGSILLGIAVLILFMMCAGGAMFG